MPACRFPPPGSGHGGREPGAGCRRANALARRRNGCCHRRRVPQPGGGYENARVASTRAHSRMLLPMCLHFHRAVQESLRVVRGDGSRRGKTSAEGFRSFLEATHHKPAAVSALRKLITPLLTVNKSCAEFFPPAPRAVSGNASPGDRKRTLREPAHVRVQPSTTHASRTTNAKKHGTSSRFVQRRRRRRRRAHALATRRKRTRERRPGRPSRAPDCYANGGVRKRVGGCRLRAAQSKVRSFSGCSGRRAARPEPFRTASA